MKRSFIDILNIIGTLIVLSVIIFAVYTLFIGSPFYESASYNDGRTIGSSEETGTYTAEKPVNRIEIRNVSGRIEAESWNGDLVRLDYVKRGPGRHPEIKIDLNGNSLKVTAVYPKAAGIFGSVDFRLMVPEGIEYLQAGSVSGSIEISGLGEKTKQKLSSTSGSVKTDSSGDIELSSVSGSLNFRSAGDDISASTTSGRIDGTIYKTNASGRINLNSVSGRITVEVPAELNAEIDLHSVSGSVSSDIPVAVTETKRNSIRGLAGRGGTDIEISTVSGAIKLSESEDS
jgi:predicted membrane protein